MSEEPFTLRSLGGSAESAFQSIQATVGSATVTVQNEAVVDWPLWILGLAGFALLFFIRPIFELLAAIAFGIRAGVPMLRDLAGPSNFTGPSDAADARLRQEGRGPYSTDQRERLRWSNREGEFAPDAKAD